MPPDCGGGEGGGNGCPSSHQWGDKEILYKIKISNDHQPWWKGAPEIYASYGFTVNSGIRGKYYMSYVDDEGVWYTVNGHLFYWQSDYGNIFMMSIWEEDGGVDKLLTITYQGQDYGIGYKDDDDQLGSNPIHFNDPCDGYYSTGDSDYYMRYQRP